ncbi:hypothetical protein G5714_002778 [Onychostoma macrolepis]|uniref:Uncharacterized protein n=1 Tax=Onychostoma macrolepis TaxID=369639 RepID=A0A7J6D7M7_9TELE|nr:hypothetical protein G5714_002778 [Onychostoma macrolepis]
MEASPTLSPNDAVLPCTERERRLVKYPDFILPANVRLTVHLSVPVRKPRKSSYCWKWSGGSTSTTTAERGKPLSVPRAIRRVFDEEATVCPTSLFDESYEERSHCLSHEPFGRVFTTKEATVCPTSHSTSLLTKEATVCPTSLYNVPSDERSPCLSHEQPREEYTYQEHGIVPTSTPLFIKATATTIPLLLSLLT